MRVIVAQDDPQALGIFTSVTEILAASRNPVLKYATNSFLMAGVVWWLTLTYDSFLYDVLKPLAVSDSRLFTYWGKHLREAFGGLSLKDMTADKVATCLENKLADGLKPATVAHHLALLKHSFTMAVKWGLLRVHPLRDVRLPVKVNNARLRDLTPEEITRLLAACPSHLQAIVLTGLHTGKRKGEILSLKWEQVDLNNQVILLGDTKNGEARGVPLNSIMVELLQRLQTEQVRTGLSSPWVFTNPLTGKPYRRDANTAWRNAKKKAGIANLHFHDTRHTTASHLRLQGADLLTIQEILGHKDLRMTARYAHVGQAHKLAAVGLLEKAFSPEPIASPLAATDL